MAICSPGHKTSLSFTGRYHIFHFSSGVKCPTSSLISGFMPLNYLICFFIKLGLDDPAVDDISNEDKYSKGEVSKPMT